MKREERQSLLQRCIKWREANIKEKQFILILSFLVGIFTAIAALFLKFLIHQIVVYILFYITGLFPFREIVIKIFLYIRVFGGCFGIRVSHVVITAVTTGNIGDVPDCIGTGTILYGRSGQSVSITFWGYCLPVSPL